MLFSKETSSANPYLEKLSKTNCALIMVDHLDGFLPGLKTIPREEYFKNVEALARIGRIFKLPTIVLGDEGGFRGTFFPVIRQHLSDATFIARHTPSGWHATQFRDTLKSFGRRKIVMGGISIDNCVTQTALDVLKGGYGVYVVVDASGTDSVLVEQAAMMRLAQAGAVMTNWVSLASELMNDWQTPEGPKVGRLYQELSAWGGE